MNKIVVAFMFVASLAALILSSCSRQSVVEVVYIDGSIDTLSIDSKLGTSVKLTDGCIVKDVGATTVVCGVRRFTIINQ